MHLQKNVKEGWNKTASGDEVWDVTDQYFLGTFHKILKSLERSLNFTTRLLLRRDSLYGHVENGSWVGKVGNLLKGEADLIVAPLSMSLERWAVINYLWPMGTEMGAIYVSKKELQRREWLAFLRPLRTRVWIYLVLNSAVLLVSMKFLMLQYKKGAQGSSSKAVYIICNAIGDYWMIFASYFGRAPAKPQASFQVPAVRFLLLAAFVSGTAVFMSYRASLTAELSTKRFVPPFTSMEGLLDSDYR